MIENIAKSLNKSAGSHKDCVVNNFLYIKGGDVVLQDGNDFNQTTVIFEFFKAVDQGFFLVCHVDFDIIYHDLNVPEKFPGGDTDEAIRGVSDIGIATYIGGDDVDRLAYW